MYLTASSRRGDQPLSWYTVGTDLVGLTVRGQPPLLYLESLHGESHRPKVGRWKRSDTPNLAVRVIPEGLDDCTYSVVFGRQVTE